MTAASATWRATACAICRTTDRADEVWPSTVDAADLTTALYSARRTPDRVHFRIVRCRGCGLLRSDPIADASDVARLYAESSFDYDAEIPGLRATYRRYLAWALAHARGRESLLEIGCGNGFLLEEASGLGVASVAGVEPSRAAVARARSDIRPNILCDSFAPGQFPPESFDVIALFQVVEHLLDPARTLDECRRLLRPGGVLLLVNHDAAAPMAQLLGERSPIVDAEHAYLYSVPTLSHLVRSRRLEPIGARIVFNRYSLRYVVRLLPLPDQLRTCALALLDALGLDRTQLWLPLGNIALIARRESG